MPRLNFTERKRIFVEDVQVSMKKVRDWCYKPELVLDLDDYKFPPDAQIWLELSNTDMFWRKQYGTVSSPGFRGPSTIEGLRADVPLYSRVKVVNAGEGTARILGLMKRVRIFGEAGSNKAGASQSFVAVVAEDLGDEVWRIEVPEDSDEVPVLSVNEQIDGCRSMASDPTFRSLVMPAVFERILVEILIHRGHREFDDTQWGRILQFAEQFHPADDVHEIPEGQLDEASISAISNWARDVVRSWSARHHFVDHYSKEFSRGDE